jgi:predicted HTH domain antitoxin
MHAVDIDQLKKNPADALRKVKDAPVLVLQDDRPAAIMLDIGEGGLLSQPEVKVALATELFRCGHLSLGRAARLAEMPLADFMRHLSERDIPIVQGTAEEGKADLDALKKWTASS